MTRIGKTRPSEHRARLWLVGVVAVLAGAAAAASLAMRGDGDAALLTPETWPAVFTRENHPTLGPHADIVRPASVIHVTARAPIESRAFPGTVHPARSSRLAFRVTGPLVALPVREGQDVAAGTLLAQVDPRDFELAVADLTARLEAADAARRLAEIHHRRQEELVRRGVVPEANLDAAIAERDRTIAEVDSTLHQLATAQAALDDTRLVAPSDGRVAGLHVELHDSVAARAPVITFHDTSATDLVVSLPESLIPRLPDVVGIDVTVSDRPGRAYAAAIREIASDRETDGGAYRTTVRLDGLESLAPLAGLSGTATFRLAETRQGSQDRAGTEVVVPSSAVFARAEGGEFVWVVTGDPPTVTARPVTVRGIADDRARLAGGLRDNERIIAYGVHFLREGQRVRPLDEPVDEPDPATGTGR